MIFELGGVSGVVPYDSALRPKEHAFLSAFSRKVGVRAFALELVDGAPEGSPAEGEPEVRWDGDVAVVTGPRFRARIDVARRRVELAREGEGTQPLQATLRAAATMFLPIEGWLPLQTTAIEIEGEFVLFSAPQRGGKSSIAAMSPYPVVGDEMISVDPFRGIARPTVFWGDNAYRPIDGKDDERPVNSIVALRRAEKFAFEWFSTEEAAQIVARAVLTPAGGPLDDRVARLVGEVLRKFRVGSMAWDRFLSPWEQLVPHLKRG